MLQLVIGAIVALLAQAALGTLRSGSAFDADRAKRVAGLWAMNLGLIIGALMMAAGFAAGLRASPMNCQDIHNLTSAVQGLNLEADGARQTLADFSHVLDRRLFPLAEAICAKTPSRRLPTHC